MKTILLALSCLLLAACDTPNVSKPIADIGARVGERIDVGVGVTKSTDGWWYAGLKVRGKPGAGSDAEVTEGEPPYVYPLLDK